MPGFPRSVPSLAVGAALLIGVQQRAAAQTAAQPGDADSTQRRHSIGSSVFLLGNLAPGDPPRFFLLNYRYEHKPRQAIFVEALTWTYYEPLGSYGSSDEKYPGKVTAAGIGIGYQRFLWRSLFITAQATPFVQQFYDSDGAAIQRGFQLYLQSRVGYRVRFLRRWFLEPSAAFNYWPVNTNFPASFRQVETGAPNYFLFEPGLHFGFRF